MATGMGIDWVNLGIVSKSQTAGMWAPLAWAIFWGLLFNTVLVLVVTPVLYYAYYSRVEKSKLFNWMKPEKASAADGESAFAASSGD